MSSKGGGLPPLDDTVYDIGVTFCGNIGHAVFILVKHHKLFIVASFLSMKEQKIFLLFGAIYGFCTVAFGAFAAHGLQGVLSTRALAVFHTGVDYQAIHALALLLVGLLARHRISHALRFAGWAFLSGVLIFSGSLYLLTLLDLTWFGAMTPIGGVMLLLGWGALIRHIFKYE